MLVMENPWYHFRAVDLKRPNHHKPLRPRLTRSTEENTSSDAQIPQSYGLLIDRNSILQITRELPSTILVANLSYITCPIVLIQELLETSIRRLQTYIQQQLSLEYMPCPETFRFELLQQKPKLARGIPKFMNEDPSLSFVFNHNPDEQLKIRGRNYIEASSIHLRWIHLVTQDCSSCPFSTRQICYLNQTLLSFAGMFKIHKHKVEGSQPMYLVSKCKQKALWKPISELGHILNLVVEYEVQRKTKLIQPQEDARKAPENAIPKSKLKPKMNLAKVEKLKSKIPARQEQRRSSRPSSPDKTKSPPNRKQLRGPALMVIDKSQFQTSMVKLSSKLGTRLKMKPQAQQPHPEPSKDKDVIDAVYAFSTEETNYFSIYYSDMSTEMLSTGEMLKRHPQLLVKILERSLD